jgi:hypothetical protein
MPAVPKIVPAVGGVSRVIRLISRGEITIIFGKGEGISRVAKV